VSGSESSVATTKPGKPNGWGSWLFGHVIAFVFCVGFPALVTAIAPVSWVRFEKVGDHVRANAKTCTLFFIPYRNNTIDPVIGIGDRFIAGKVERRRSNESRTRSEDEAFLVIHGEQVSVEVPVTPFNIKSVTERSKTFIEAPTDQPLKMFVVANWKFSMIAGGLISLLTVLYVVGVVLSFFAMLKRLAFPRAASTFDVSST
jgi:hypothetical protein